MTYRVVLRPAAVRALQRMPEKISAACWELIHGPLAENPHRVGKPLLSRWHRNTLPAEASTECCT